MVANAMQGLTQKIDEHFAYLFLKTEDSSEI